jgi:hypothetical protein
MKFIVSEYAILNEKANTDLPNNVGDLVIVSRIKKDSPNFEYDVTLPSGDYVPVKEKEINKLTERQREYMTYIQKDNTVIYIPTNEEVVITKTDYLHGQVAIMFEDGGATTVGFESLRELVGKVTNEHQVKSRTQSHMEVIEEIHNTFKIKNADYGNSFGEQYEEYGLLSAVIRLDDKMRRLKQLLKQDAQVKDESIRDTVLDLANYAIMTVMELDKEN